MSHIRPVIRDGRPEGPATLSRFPAAFRPPAFASRSSDSRRGIGLSSRSAYRARPSARTSTGLPRSARTSCDRGGCPLYPEDDGARPAGSPPRPAPAASQRQSLNPATTSHHARLSFTRHQQGFTHVHPSGLPLARAPGMEPEALRLPPELRTPPSPAAHVEGGDRPSSTDLEQRSQHQPSLRSCVFTQCVRPRVARRAEGARAARARHLLLPERGTQPRRGERFPDRSLPAVSAALV